MNAILIKMRKHKSPKKPAKNCGNCYNFIYGETQICKMCVHKCNWKKIEKDE